MKKNKYSVEFENYDELRAVQDAVEYYLFEKRVADNSYLEKFSFILDTMAEDFSNEAKAEAQKILDEMKKAKQQKQS